MPITPISWRVTWSNMNKTPNTRPQRGRVFFFMIHILLNLVVWNYLQIYFIKMEKTENITDFVTSSQYNKIIKL